MIRKKPRESREKNQRETEEMYKSFGSGFNPRQKSISFLQRFFCNAIFIGIVTGKNLVVRSKEKTQTTTHPRSNQQEQQKNRLTAVTFGLKINFISLLCFVFGKCFNPGFSSTLRKNKNENCFQERKK